MPRARWLLFASISIVTSSALTACVGESEGPQMRPGDDCGSCHRFTVAGTVFSKANDSTGSGVDGVTVIIRDATGHTVTLQSNAAGNFYTDEPLTFPIGAELHRGTSVARMVQSVPTGACSSCHNQPPANNAPGRNFVAAP